MLDRRVPEIRPAGLFRADDLTGADRMNPVKTLLLAALALGACASSALLPAGSAYAGEGDSPGIEALSNFRVPSKSTNPVQNRFFLKAKRFELTPQFGYVPNNPFARRFSVGLGFGYHFSELVSLQGSFDFAPDLGEQDLKALTGILLDRATDDEFTQPLDKVTLSAAFGVNFAPFYGKINLLGETVVNFDFFGFLGIGMVVQTEYAAVENPDAVTGTLQDVVDLNKLETEVRPAPIIGLGGNFFLTQTIALRVGSRFALIIDDKPLYDPDNPDTGLRVNNLFTASAGVSFFFPKMKPRLYDF